MPKKFFRSILISDRFLVLFSVLSLILATYLATLPDPLTVTRVVDKPPIPVVKVGGTLTFTRHVCNTDPSLKVEVQRRAVNNVTGKEYVIHKQPYTPSVGCRNLSFIVVLPNTLPPGNYTYYPHIFYELNSFNKISKPLPEVDFIIK